MAGSVRDTSADSGSRFQIAYLGLGASLGDRRQNLCDALVRLDGAGARVAAASPLYESPHLGLEPGDAARYPAHLNLVARIETALPPEALLNALQAIEAAGGRERLERWAPRTIDIDILDYAGTVLSTGRLALPHPGIAVRAFVARPLVDLAPDFRLPDGTLLRDALAREPLRSQPIAHVGALPWS